jgi:hypothetical protein
VQPLHWGHLSYRGHRVAGEALVAKLESILGGHKERVE